MSTFDTPDPIFVTVELGVGAIRIAATDRTDTVVDVRPSDPTKKTDVTAAAQTQVEFADGRLSVRTPKLPHRWSPFGPSGRSGSVEVEIGVPEGSQVSSETGAATLRSHGRLGDCRYRTGAGDVYVERADALVVRTGAGSVTLGEAAGTVTVSVGSGSVVIDRVAGELVIKSGNGDTRVGEVTGDARLNAANGTITIDRAHRGVVAKTANGSVRIGEVSQGAVVAQSAMGTVEVGVRDGVAAWLDLGTKFGQVRNDLDATDGPGTSTGTVEVHASTSFGDVAVFRASPVGTTS
jgi:hypothetical protein